MAVFPLSQAMQNHCRLDCSVALLVWTAWLQQLSIASWIAIAKQLVVSLALAPYFMVLTKTVFSFYFMKPSSDSTLLQSIVITKLPNSTIEIITYFCCDRHVDMTTVSNTSSFRIIFLQEQKYVIWKYQYTFSDKWPNGETFNNEITTYKCPK